MKSAFVLSALCATLALAKPVKRDVEYAVHTDMVYETVVVTVTGEKPSPTPGAFYSSSSVVPAVVTQVPTTTPAPKPAPAPTSSSQAPAAAPASSSSGGAPDSWSQSVLEQHNIHRRNHSSPDMTWSSSMASLAQQIANTCNYKHQMNVNGANYGQNIGAGYEPSGVPGMITNDMYDGEIVHYNAYGGEPSMSVVELSGHATQIIWKGSTSVGCATAYCSGGLQGTSGGISPYFTVCNYQPTGNVIGEYAANVLQPLGEASVHV